MQHVIAMFGATLLVPTLTGFPVNTTLLFSGVGDDGVFGDNPKPAAVVFGSSFAFIAPLLASKSLGVWGAAGWRGGCGPGAHGSGVGVKRLGKGIMIR